MMETVAPALHDAILLGVGIAGVYMVVALLQLAQIKRQNSDAMRPVEPSLKLQSAIEKASTEKINDASEGKTFAQHLRRTNIEIDLQRLHDEVIALRNALSVTQEEIKSLRPQRLDSRAAPLYNEAMTLARRGLNEASIAARCGISMGEAELVMALTCSPQEVDADAAALKLKFADKVTNEQRLHGFRAAA